MITEKDLIGINTHGFKTEIDEQGYMTVDMPMVVLTVHKRNFYCNRGRYGFWAEVKQEFNLKMNVDAADAFPRYFFDLQRAFDEMKDWEDFRTEKLNIKP